MLEWKDDAFSYEKAADLAECASAAYYGKLSMRKFAKTAKLDKKLKMIELQLKKEKQDRDSNPNNNDIVNGDGYVVTDRNSLLAQLKGMNKDK